MKEEVLRHVPGQNTVHKTFRSRNFLMVVLKNFKNLEDGFFRSSVVCSKYMVVMIVVENIYLHLSPVFSAYATGHIPNLYVRSSYFWLLLFIIFYQKGGEYVRR